MDYKKIEALTFDELDGSITPEDKAFLYNAIKEDKDAWLIWKKIHDESPWLVADAKESLDEHPAEEVVEQLISGNRRLSFQKMTGIAAATLLAIAGSWYFFNSKSHKPIAATTAGQEHIQLVMANGKQIDLSEDTTAMQIGHTTLKNSQKTLSFTSANHTESGLNTLTVPPGKDYNILLADGTQIQLNSATTISFPFNFTGSTREVTINGEAYFTVAGNAAKPFIVHLPNNTIKVLGTSFNINTYEEGTAKIALVNGSVKVESAGNNKILQPGFEITSTENGMTLSRFDADKVLSWRQGIFTFESATLKDLSDIIPRWYGVKVILDNERVSNRRFFGIVNRNQPLDNFLHNLQASDSVKYHFDQQGILHFE
ncbi:FecR family protein [Chitinophaga solisilvae]|uniref:DUF4974 domain-containing protein n=1 Tax=Chitinophaga solisilvae TaxID=1233460 RepID=A0A433WCI7_9BACT|nr:FecR domain-containing protein [Chitinophaga solisilvae]NSL90755.1 DUF4974 domain-containing protein [Chitinophaga solisilvae]